LTKDDELAAKQAELRMKEGANASDRPHQRNAGNSGRRDEL